MSMSSCWSGTLRGLQSLAENKYKLIIIISEMVCFKTRFIHFLKKDSFSDGHEAETSLSSVPWHFLQWRMRSCFCPYKKSLKQRRKFVILTLQGNSEMQMQTCSVFEERVESWEWERQNTFADFLTNLHQLIHSVLKCWLKTRKLNHLP